MMAGRSRDKTRTGATGLLLAALLFLSSCGGRPEATGPGGTVRNAPAAALARGGAKATTEHAPLPADGIYRLSRREALDLAFRYNRSLRMARLEKKRAAGQAEELRSVVMPQLSLTGSYTRLDEVPSADLGGGAIELGKLNNYSASLTLTQPLFLGGRMGAALRSARFVRRLADMGYREAEINLRAGALAAYDDLLLARHLVKVTEKSLETAREHAADAEKKFNEGVISRYELLRARVRVANVRAGSVAAGNAARMAETNLLRLLGLSLAAKVEPLDDLAVEPTKVGREEAFARARRERPDLRRLGLQLRLQEEKIRTVRADLLPSVQLMGSLSEEQPSRKDFTGGEAWEFSWNAGAQISIPIFDGLRTRGRLRQERARLEQIRLQRADLEAQIELEVTQALASLDDAEAMIESQQGNVEDAEEALRLVRVGRNEGVRTELEVIDAQTARDHARRSHYQALHAYRRALILLDRALGSAGAAAETGPPEKTPVPVPEVPVLPTPGAGPATSPETSPGAAE